MTIAITSPVTGAAQTGFTAPTYTLTADTPPSVNMKQWAVTAIGGTQTSVDLHGASKPFTITVAKPANVRAAPVPNANGLIGNVPRNVYSVFVRKGAVPVSGQAPQVMVFRCDFSVAAGADIVEPEDIRAAVSLLIGSLSQQSAGIGDTLINNLL